MARPLTRQQQWRRKHPRQYLAHLYVQAAKRIGLLTPQPCEVCGAKAEAHHPDYERPGDVRWLCRVHHRQLHARGGPGVNICAQNADSFIDAGLPVFPVDTRGGGRA